MFHHYKHVIKIQYQSEIIVDLLYVKRDGRMDNTQKAGQRKV